MLYCFAAARFTQIKANDKVVAGSIVQSNAEMIKSFDSSSDMNEYFSENYKFNTTSKNEITYINYYDKHWNICDEESKIYFISVRVKDVSYIYGEMKEISITAEKEKPYPFVDNNNNIYEIHTKKFYPSNEGRW
jgi:Cdc6-like AAA superfamily ATPase